ncbi:uncharacterized protein METZ01_LOCUS245208, partial [marine metagenome]
MQALIAPDYRNSGDFSGNSGNFANSLQVGLLT